MADSRAVKQPRQSDFDRVTFTQSPLKPANEPVMPIDLLIPKQNAPEKEALATEPTPQPKSVEPTQKVKPSPAPSAESAEELEPPKDKISVMLPVAMIERLKNIAFWERMTVAALVEQGLNVVLAEKERKHGGPYEQREGALKTGRPVGITRPYRAKEPTMKKRTVKR